MAGKMPRCSHRTHFALHAHSFQQTLSTPRRLVPRSTGCASFTLTVLAALVFCGCSFVGLTPHEFIHFFGRSADFERPTNEFVGWGLAGGSHG